jgi:hypothetical protein
MKYVTPYLTKPLRSEAQARDIDAPCGAAKFDRWYADQTRNRADTRQGMTHGQCVSLEAGQ